MFRQGLGGSASFVYPIFSYIRNSDRFSNEIYLIAASYWAAFVLATPPSNFAAFPKGFSLAASLEAHESVWAAVAFLSATLKLIGIVVYLSKNQPTLISDMLRCAGLSLSGIFWMALGVSTVVGNPDTLFGIWGIIAGLSAWRTLLRFAALPENV